MSQLNLALVLKADAKGFTPEVRAAEKSVRDLGQGATEAGRKADAAGSGLERHKNTITQLGFQAQDAAVQLAGGTSALTVLIQQGSQVAGAFGPAGVAIAAVGSTVGAAAQYFFAAESKAEDLGDILNDVTSPAFLSGADTARQYSEALKGATADQVRLIQSTAQLQQVVNQGIAQKALDELASTKAVSKRLADLAAQAPGTEVQGAFGEFAAPAYGQGAAQARADVLGPIDAAIRAGDTTQVQRLLEQAGVMGDPDGAALGIKLINLARNNQLAKLAQQNDRAGSTG